MALPVTLPLMTTQVSKMEAEGPVIWRTLKALADRFHEQPEVYTEIVDTVISDILLCAPCRQDGIEYLRTHPVISPPRWICDYHNSINLKLGKLVYPCPVERPAKALDQKKYVAGNYYTH